MDYIRQLFKLIHLPLPLRHAWRWIEVSTTPVCLMHDGTILLITDWVITAITAVTITYHLHIDLLVYPILFKLVGIRSHCSLAILHVVLITIFYSHWTTKQFFGNNQRTIFYSFQLKSKRRNIICAMIWYLSSSIF